MKSSVHTFLSLVGLALLIALSCGLDTWVNAAANRMEINHDTSWAWAKILSRLTISSLLLGCAAFVLRPSHPNRVVAIVYLSVGVFLTALAHPLVSACVTLATSAEWYLFQVRAISLPTTGAFVAAIGMASLLRRTARPAILEA